MIETLASQAEARPVRFGAATNNILPCFIALDRANKRTESFFNFIIHFEKILTLFSLNYGIIKNRDDYRESVIFQDQPFAKFT